MMSQKKRTAAAGVKQLTADEFMAKHKKELAENDFLKVGAPPPAFSKATSGALGTPLDPEVSAYFTALTNTHEFRLLSELRKWWRIRLLRAAKEENSPEAYRELLEGLLIRLCVEAPDGVFIPRRGSRGAPRKQSTEQIYGAWIANGLPSWGELAFFSFGRDYTVADEKQRKKLRDRCRQAVGRESKRLATKLLPD
jgi:hypothetical protein